MSNRAGQRGTVVRNERDSLHYRLMLDDVESTLTAAEVAILDTNGTRLPLVLLQALRLAALLLRILVPGLALSSR